MKPKAITTLIASAFLLLGCANTDHYPVTGQKVGVNDQVKYMMAPDVMPR